MCLFGFINICVFSINWVKHKKNDFQELIYSGMEGVPIRINLMLCLPSAIYIDSS